MTSTTTPAPAAADVTRLMQDLERNRVLPPGGGDVLASVKLAGDPALPDVADALLGRCGSTSTHGARRSSIGSRARVRRTAPRSSRCWPPGTVTPPAGDILRQAATDRNDDPPTRATALGGLAAATGPGALERAIDAFASLDVAAPGLDDNLDSAWRQFVSSGPTRRTSRRFAISTARRMHSRSSVTPCWCNSPPSRSPSGGGERWWRAGGRGGRGQAAASEAARTEAREAIEAAWQGPSWRASCARSARPRPPATAIAFSLSDRRDARDSRRGGVRGHAPARGNRDRDAPRSWRTVPARSSSRARARRRHRRHRRRPDAVHPPGLRDLPLDSGR